PAIEQRAEKDRQEPSLEELDFPTVAVPNLTDVDDGHVHRPDHDHQNRIRVAAKNDERKRETNPREDRHPKVGTTKPEKSRHLQHAHGSRTKLRMNVVKKIVRRIQTVPADERN